MEAAQSRAARALLDWSQDELSERAGVSRKSLYDFEAGRRSPRETTITKLQAALEKAGVEFIPENGGGPGVRLAKRRGKR